MGANEDETRALERTYNEWRAHRMTGSGRC